MPDAQDKLCRYTGVDWNCAADSFDPIGNTITRNGVTDFSDWVSANDAGPTAVTLRAVTAAAGRLAPTWFVLPAIVVLLTLVSLWWFTSQRQRRQNL